MSGPSSFLVASVCELRGQVQRTPLLLEFPSMSAGRSQSGLSLYLLPSMPLLLSKRLNNAYAKCICSNLSRLLLDFRPTYYIFSAI